MFSPDPSEKESGFEEIAALEAEIEKLTKEMKEVQDRIRSLRDSEDPARKIFHHQEIFSSQQNKLRLEVEIDLRRKKINRIKLAMNDYDLFQPRTTR